MTTIAPAQVSGGIFGLGRSVSLFAAVRESVFGPKQTRVCVALTSAFGGKADIRLGSPNETSK